VKDLKPLDFTLEEMRDLLEVRDRLARGPTTTANAESCSSGWAATPTPPNPAARSCGRSWRQLKAWPRCSDERPRLVAAPSVRDDDRFEGSPRRRPGCRRVAPDAGARLGRVGRGGASSEETAMSEIVCPSCGVDDHLSGRRQGDVIRITCGACGVAWDRDPSPRCEICGTGEKLLAVSEPLVQKARGNQYSVVGARTVYRCDPCHRRASGDDDSVPEGASGTATL